ncbi:MAG: RNA polymerase factor sigma-54 [Candidatus Cryptobacteroides sp.]
MLKQGLELKQTQRLSPLQIQTIKMLERTRQEMEQSIKDVLEDNPVLDLVSEKDQDSKDISIDEINENDPTPAYKLYVNNYGKEDRPQYNSFSVKDSFTQSLLEQLGYRNLTKHQYDVASFIVGSLDADGYLRRDIDSLVDDLAFRANIETTNEEILQMLSIIQELEPVGVGARDLQECLLLQLKAMKQTDDVILAEIILEKYFQEFSSRHFNKLLSKMGIEEKDLKGAIARIVKLNPAPGGQIDDSYNDQAQQIIPDFLLENVDGKLKLSMPKFSIPEVKVNKKYADILEESKNSQDKSKKEAVAFIKQKIESAKWFLEAIKQRQNTLQSTMQAILEYQHDYFIDGDETHLKPMVLKDIAEKTGFDISTISRVVNSKYIETHFGIYPLKYFFSEGLENQEGEEISTRELKKVLQECVNNENKKQPLTDDQLVEEMTVRGYKVARRTIAKYREQLGIQKARLRKEF